jgi:DMSO/TMAO reductase YedYZ molybdopterin-dependent catalytic subunit
MTAKQGHTYEWNGLKVMAMESGPFPEIRVMDHERPWPLTVVGRVDATSLTPLPMAYFGERDNARVRHHCNRSEET